MALDVTKIPPLVSFCGNGIPFQITSDNLFTSDGVIASCTIFKNDDALEIDDTLIFEWGNNSITLTAKHLPDDSGYQLLANSSNAAIFAGINSNYYLAKDFNIILLGGNIIFEARQAGADYNLEITINSDAYEYIEITTGVDAVKRPSFFIIAEALAVTEYLDGAAFGNQILGTDRIPPSNDQTIIFDPSEYILQKFDYDFEFPVSDIFILHESAICKYFVRCAEQYNIPTEFQKFIYGTYFYALPGALTKENLLLFSNAEESWWGNLSENKTFLSNSPAKRLTSKTIPEKLWFLCFFESEVDTKLNVSLILDDNTTANFDASEIGMSQFEVYEINVGYAALGIEDYINENHLGKKCYSWSVVLTNDDNIVTERKTFTLDPREHIWERCFVFKNEFGFYEALRTTGKAITSNQISREVFTNNYVLDNNNEQSKFSKSSDATSTIELQSGYFDSFELCQYAAEGFKSDNIFEIVNNTKMPIIILTDEIKIKKDGENAYYFMFEYEYAIGHKHYITRVHF